MSIRIIQLLVVLLVFAGDLYFGQAQSINIVDENGKQIIRTDAVLKRGTTYLPVEVLSLVFDPDLTQKYIPLTKKLTLTLGKKQIHFRINVTSIQIEPGDESAVLPHPPLLIKRKPFLPIEFFTQLVPQIYIFDVSYNTTLRRMQVIEKISGFTENGADQFTAIIDFGHGGKDTGCYQNGILEKDLVLRLAERIQMEASDRTIKILLTRDSDTTLYAKDRIRFSNRKTEAKLFISVHCNMSFSTKKKGLEVYVNNSKSDLLKIDLEPNEIGNANDQSSLFKPLTQDHFLDSSRQLATVLKRQFEDVLDQKVSVFELPLNMIRNIYMPAVLVEIGYFSNPLDLKKLKTNQFLSQAAVALLQAIERYQEIFMTKNKLGSTEAEVQ